ncbi:MAG: PIN domain-containing protein [Chloroflexota bacterium]|nr:PIN domain-containing protein [Chloroflexota bacterium]
MSEPHIDTDVIVRLVTGDDPDKQAAAAQLFQDVEDGTLTVRAPVTVIADAVFVLCSTRLYNVPRQKAAAALARLVRIPGFRIDRRRTVLAALNLFGVTRLDFGDCMLVASMRQAGATIVYSYDTDFDRFPEIERREPPQHER